MSEIDKSNKRNWDGYLQGYWTWRNIIDTLRLEINFLKYPNEVTEQEFSKFKQESLTMLEYMDTQSVLSDPNKRKKFESLMKRRKQLTKEFEEKLKAGKIRFYPEDKRKKM